MKAFLINAIFATSVAASALSKQHIFSRPVLSRAYEQNQWVLRNANGSGLRETPESVGKAIAGLKPSYVSGLIYLQSETNVTDEMIKDWNTIRCEVRKDSREARFDVEISLNPKPPTHMPFASAKALREKMKQLDKILQPDGWWFDFYSTAQKDHSDWIVAAADYAHTHNQTIGGNVFGDEVPPHSDAIAFVDDPVKNSKFGFDFNENQIAKLKANTTDAVILGHLQSNAQNGETTESCVYIQQWNDTKRMEYLRHWDESQCSLGFRFMWPVFYPLCPGAFAFDPLGEEGKSGRSLYEEIKGMIMGEKKCQQERL